MCVDWSELNGDSSEGLGLAADGQAEGGRRVGSEREKLEDQVESSCLESQRS